MYVRDRFQEKLEDVTNRVALVQDEYFSNIHQTYNELDQQHSLTSKISIQKFKSLNKHQNEELIGEINEYQVKNIQPTQ